MAIKVFNMLTGNFCAEFSHNDPYSATAYCYAENNNMMSLFSHLIHDKEPLEKHFPFTIGRFSVSCGDYAAAI